MCSYCGHPLYDNQIHAEDIEAIDDIETIESTIDTIEDKDCGHQLNDNQIHADPQPSEEEDKLPDNKATASSDFVALESDSDEPSDAPVETTDETEEIAEKKEETTEEPEETTEEAEETTEEPEETTEEPKSTIEEAMDTPEEPVVIVEDANEDAIIVVDGDDNVSDDKASDPTPSPAVPQPIQKKEYSRRHVSDKIGRKEEPKSKSKVLSLANESEETDIDEEEEKKERRFSKWLHWSLFLFFLTIIAAGVGAFMYYDNLVSRKKEAQERAVQDSLFNLERTKQQRIKAERATEDSLLNQQISAQHESDSLDKVRQNEFRRLDSIRVDTFMTRVITDVCPSNRILARQLDGQNYIYYYTDLANPIFKLYGFDGVKKETFTIIDDIQAQLVGSYVTPDRRNLIILCRDEKHEFGLAYKYNMYESTLADYESMDKDGNKCYDVGTTEDGFYMKFGKQDGKTFQSLYTSFFDKYGNFITQQ